MAESPQKFGGAQKGRCTAAEKERRVRDVYNLLSNAASRQEIIQYAAENWGLTDRSTDNYIADARLLIEEDCSLSRQAFLAECLSRLRNYEKQAAKRGQMQVATNSVRLQAELVGLTSKSA